MRLRKWSIAAGTAALLVVAATACANDAGSGQPAGSASAQPSVAGSAASSAAGKSTPPARTDGVTVTMSAGTYAVGDTLKLTVRNGRSATIYTEDFQTQCTMVTLQKSNSGSWTDITGCMMERPTRTVKLEPGETTVIMLDPHGFHLAEGPGELGFGAGTYRIKFGYRLGMEPMGAQPLTAYSSDFRVR